MSWNEFQAANKGKYNNTEMSEVFSQYKAESYPNGGEHYLNRPYIRESVINEVNQNTIYNAQGQIYDTIGDKWVDSSKVELGHVPSHEFWYERNQAESMGMSQSQFNDYMNNSSFYAWQDIHDNRSHSKEDKH